MFVTDDEERLREQRAVPIREPHADGQLAARRPRRASDGHRDLHLLSPAKAFALAFGACEHLSSESPAHVHFDAASPCPHVDGAIAGRFVD